MALEEAEAYPALAAAKSLIGQRTAVVFHATTAVR